MMENKILAGNTRVSLLVIVVLTVASLAGCSVGGPDPLAEVTSRLMAASDHGVIAHRGAEGTELVSDAIGLRRVAAWGETEAGGVTMYAAGRSGSLDGFEELERSDQWTVYERQGVNPVGVPAFAVGDGVVITGRTEDVIAATLTTPIELPEELDEGLAMATSVMFIRGDQLGEPEWLVEGTEIGEFAWAGITRSENRSGIIAALMVEEAAQSDAIALSVRASTVGPIEDGTPVINVTSPFASGQVAFAEVTWETETPLQLGLSGSLLDFLG